MNIGILRAANPLDRRVAVTPPVVRKLAERGATVWVETGAAFSVFPCMLPSNTNPALRLAIWNTATAHYGLAVGLAWWIPGMILVAGYTVFAYRHFAGKVRLEEEGY